VLILPGPVSAWAFIPFFRKPCGSDRQGEGRRRGPQKADLAEGEIVKRLEPYIIAYDQDTLEGAIGRLLTEKGLTLAVAESCTGGLLTDRLTDIPEARLTWSGGW